MKKKLFHLSRGFFEYHIIIFKQLIGYFFIHAYKKKLETLYQKPKEATKTVVFLNICMTLHRYMHGYTEKMVCRVPERISRSNFGPWTL